MEPDAASEKATTGASLVRRKVGQVTRGTSDVGVASGCTTVFARLRGGGKILAAKSTLLDVRLWMTGASLKIKAELLEAILWCSLLCAPFTTCLQKGGTMLFVQSKCSAGWRGGRKTLVVQKLLLTVKCWSILSCFARLEGGRILIAESLEMLFAKSALVAGNERPLCGKRLLLLAAASELQLSCIV